MCVHCVCMTCVFVCICSVHVLCPCVLVTTLVVVHPVCVYVVLTQYYGDVTEVE